MKYSTYYTMGNIIKSAIVNDGFEIWIAPDDLYGSAPIQTLKAGYYNSMTNIDVRI